MIELKREGDVFVLKVDDGENRFRPGSLARWNAALDEVEAAASKSSSAWASSPISASHNAFIACGRFRVMTPMLFFFSALMWSKAMGSLFSLLVSFGTREL